MQVTQATILPFPHLIARKQALQKRSDISAPTPAKCHILAFPIPKKPRREPEAQYMIAAFNRMGFKWHLYKSDTHYELAYQIEQERKSGIY